VASFKDTAGREWSITIDPWHIKFVHSKTGVHLGKLLDNKFAGLSELLGDPIALVDVIFALCSEQAAKLGISDEQFGRSLDGDCFEKASAAFQEAFICFCPSRLRQVLRAATVKAMATQDAATTKAMEKIAALDVSSLFATDSAESSASIPPG